MYSSKLACGIMSGTSLDGIDVVLASISGVGFQTKIEMISGKTYPYPNDILDKVKLAINNELKVKDISSLNFELGKLYAECVKALCREEKIQTSSLAFIASHGQTVYHQSYIEDGMMPSTLQLGSGSIIAALTQTTVVYDFRVADMAFGGQGAPLVPYVDFILLSSKEKFRVVQNIGGISNITVLPPGQDESLVYAFDTGPGNMMINRAMEVLYQEPYDKSGLVAKSGKMIHALFDEIINHPYLKIEPPKSTGREQFGVTYTDNLINKYSYEAKADIVHTITQATVETMVISFKRFIKNVEKIDELIISGGGVHNLYMMELLKRKLPQSNIFNSDEIQLSSDFKEALAFIVLGNQTMNHQTGNLTTTTGAKQKVILGSIALS